ncbi:bifunctional YncE family protein/alkaline phosphatase family protein [Niabella sp. CC-SYL272]|uniref:bifunctional YncE family protein/alkaline phosphatase family protein n=1 Tax=Niabella agricola TaxID=2891571 RepID=UPI001F3553DB|nr:bifunctional YncE family protein/alkaline phosphatase family protein [Niabella agricola]MCF3109141.1 bifunctional YncE family protein/alkaline phosphatase family protein [Niabella agricola]
MNRVSCFIAAIVLAIMVVPGFSQPRVERDKILLPNGWSLTPAGTQLPLGDLPLNLVISNNRRLAAVTNNGQSTQTIDLVDLMTKKRIDSIIIAKSWYGLAFSSNDHYLYASGGHDNVVKRYALQNNRLALKDSFVLGEKWPNRIGTAGLDVDDKSTNQLYVVTREDSSLYIFDLATKKIKCKTGLGSEAYTCKLSPDRKKLYISIWGGGKLLVWDVARQKITATIATGNHPNEICISKNGKLLYVANANDNSVSVINTANNKVTETLNAALYPNAPSGSTSNGVALSADEKTLYVANADNNCLAVFDVSVPSKSVSKGFIPVGWYPTNVKVVGKQILVTNGKGLSSMANPYGPNPVNKKEVVLRHAGDSSRSAKVQYIAGLFRGSLSFIHTPTPQQLAVYARSVYQNTPYSKSKELNAQGEAGNPVPMKVGAPSPIKHVFYVIKENRTYDQVLGDVARGNGDSSLCLFGERITPNQHKIVSDFVLLDNFYVDAEVSADGHNWSMGAYATDYLEKTWPSSYGGRGGTYGGEGERKVANNRDGFIWDHAARSKVSFRTYGEFVDDGKAKLDVLSGHFARGYTGYDLSVADTTRFRQWKQDFDSLVAANALPQLTTLRFGNDHTEGMRAGRKTPFAHVADNDLAVGMFVDYISKSPIWKECAIFILEDDAQNGPDHVDAHRSTAYVISPYVKRRSVDHTMYSTSGMLRTIELILGMPPMTQYDAAATPMWRCFTAVPDFTAFDHLPANMNLLERNPAQGRLAAWSEQFDWSKEDAVPDLVFNDILWMGIKGTPAPSPVRAAFLKFPEKKKKGDDD